MVFVTREHEPMDEMGDIHINHVVITVHGIRTFGQWQERLEKLLKDADPDIKTFNYKFGRFSLIAFFIPFLRWLVTRKFRRDFLEIVRSFPKGTRIDLVGHSFGTHLIAWGLRGIPESKFPSVHTIILAGSVLKPSFRWNIIQTKVPITRIINECGVYDRVLVLNQVFVLFTGVAGILGFHGMTGQSLRNNFYLFGHSGYFQAKGVDLNEFMTKRWVPLLTSDAELPLEDERPKSAKYQAWIFFLQNLDQVKVVAYLVIVSFLLVLVNNYLATRAMNDAQKWANESSTVRKNYPDKLPQSVEFAILSVVRYPTLEGDKALRRSLTLLPRLLHVMRVEGPIQDLALNADESQVAIVFGDRKLQIRSASDGTLQRSLDVHRQIEAISFSATGEVWLVDRSGTLSILRRNGEVNSQSIATEPEKAAIYSGSEMLNVATASQDFSGRIWQYHSRRIVKFRHDNRIISMAFSGNGKWLATGAYDNTARVWDASGSALMRKPINLNHPVSAVAITHDGGAVALGDTFGGIQVKNLDGDRETLFRTTQKGPITSLAFSTDGHWLASASGGDNTARVWDIDSGHEIARMTHEAPVEKVVFSHDGRRLMTGDENGAIRIWDITANRPVRMDGRVCALRFATASRTQLAVGDTYGNVEIVSLAEGIPDRVVRTVTKQDAAVLDIGFVRSSDSLVALFDDGIIRKWVLGKAPKAAPEARVSSAWYGAISAEGDSLAVSGNSDIVRINRVRDGLQLAMWRLSAGVLAIAISADGDLVASGSDDHKARIWSMSSRFPELELPHDGPVSSVAFSDDSKYLATTSGKNVRVWKIGDHEPFFKVVDQIAAPDQQIDVISFSPDGRLLVTAGTDNAARIWDWHANTLVGQVGDFTGRVCRTSFSSDGTRLAVGGEDGRTGSAVIGYAMPAAGVAEACSRLSDFFKSGTNPKSVDVTTFKNACLSNSGLVDRVSRLLTNAQRMYSNLIWQKFRPDF